jgi:Tn3 transposase DDE domain
LFADRLILTDQSFVDPDKPEKQTVGHSLLDRAIRALKQHGRPVDENLLQHLSPLGWEHINLTGDYAWHRSRAIEMRKFRPLRPFFGA